MDSQCQLSFLQAVRAACAHLGPPFVYFWAPQKLSILLHILTGVSGDEDLDVDCHQSMLNPSASKTGLYMLILRYIVSASRDRICAFDACNKQSLVYVAGDAWTPSN